MDYEDEVYFRLLVADKATVIHAPTGTIGKVKGARTQSRQAGAAVHYDLVVELEEGHSFVARRRDAFVRLKPAEVELHKVVCEQLRQFVYELAVFAASGGTSQSTFEALMGAALRGQLAAIAAKAGASGGNSGPVYRPNPNGRGYVTQPDGTTREESDEELRAHLKSLLENP